MNAETIERMRPAAVEKHVKDVLRRAGCDDFAIQRAQLASAEMLRSGATAHRAIRAGIEAGVQQKLMQNALGPMPHAPTARDHFVRDVLLDSLGLVGLIVIAALLVLTMYAFMGKPA